MESAPHTSERERVAAWSQYQPGFRFTTAPVGSAEFFRDVAENRYRLEPQIEEIARFDDWAGRDVLEAGCGIATDGARFARAGARYTGVDFSPVAIELARRQFELGGLDGNFVEGSISNLPFPDGSFDLVYSNGVLHHMPDPRGAIAEIHRVLRPGGRARVMVYHRDSLNYRVTILVIRRLLAPLVLLPGVAAAVTRERPEVIDGHRELLRRHGIRYLADRDLFLSHNTDGPQNPYSTVYSRDEGERLFEAFSSVQTSVRYLNLRTYPFGERLARTQLARRLEPRLGWHLWIDAVRGRFS